MAVNYFLSTVGSDVEVFNNYATFRQATADNASPIPGYLFGEVTAITHESNGQNCKALISYFISRLQCPSPLVKIKVLKLLLYIAKNGHRNVLDELRMHEISLKEATGSSGSLEDSEGKAFYESVRKMAQELLVLVFSDDHVDEMSCDSLLQQELQHMSGIGSQASTKKFAGFGNVPFTQKTLTERVTEQVSNVVKFLSPNEEDDYYKKQGKILNELLPHYNPVSVSRTESNDSCAISTVVHSSPKSNTSRYAKKVHMVGKPGGGWDDTDEDNDNAISTRDSAEHSLSADSLENKMELPLCLDWLEEHKLVDDFTISEPLELLKWAELDSLCKKSSTLNCDKICEFLVEKLSMKEKENVKLRCLVFLEYLLHYDLISIESVTDIALPLLHKLSESSESPIQVKSKKLCLILKCLGGDQQ